MSPGQVFARGTKSAERDTDSGKLSMGLRELVAPDCIELAAVHGLVDRSPKREAVGS
jgi:hypothetical protein